MLFAIDFDRTFNRDTAFWKDFLDLLEHHDHSAVLVTARSASHDNQDLYRIIAFSGISEVYFTDGQPKKPYLASKKIHPDIWIDDDPASIDPDGRLHPCDNSQL